MKNPFTSAEVEKRNRQYRKERLEYAKKIRKFFLEEATEEQQLHLSRDLLKYAEEYGCILLNNILSEYWNSPK